jgi:hypothetical protein
MANARRPTREALDKVDRENPNASPAEKYRRAQALTLISEIERGKRRAEANRH